MVCCTCLDPVGSSVALIGTFTYLQFCLIGHQRVDWAEPETPRSVDDPSYVHTGAENELSGEGNYTHAGGQGRLVLFRLQMTC